MVLGGALAMSTNAAATHGGAHPTFRNERVYFHCAGPSKVENANNGAPSPWNTTAPAGSYQAGNGCGWLDPGATSGASADAGYSGTFTGNLKSLTIEAHNLLLSQVDANNIRRITVTLSVDGTELMAADTFVDMSPELSSTGLTEKFLISITGLGCTKNVLDANGNVINVITDGLATEDADGTTVHQIRLTLDSSYTDRGGAWVQDATEIASGITFNPATLAPSRISPGDPATC
jgi:hypothetical protein